MNRNSSSNATGGGSAGTGGDGAADRPNHLEPVRRFNRELENLYTQTNQISVTQMSRITKIALEDLALAKYIVHSVERFVQKCPPRNKLTALYIIDSLVRKSKRDFTGPDKHIFEFRFAENLRRTIENALDTCIPEEKSKITALVGVWFKTNVFRSEVIEPLVEYMYAHFAGQDNDEDSNNVQQQQQKQHRKHKQLRLAKEETPPTNAANINLTDKAQVISEAANAVSFFISNSLHGSNDNVALLSQLQHLGNALNLMAQHGGCGEDGSDSFQVFDNNSKTILNNIIDVEDNSNSINNKNGHASTINSGASSIQSFDDQAASKESSSSFTTIREPIDNGALKKKRKQSETIELICLSDGEGGGPAPRSSSRSPPPRSALRRSRSPSSSSSTRHRASRRDDDRSKHSRHHTHSRRRRSSSRSRRSRSRSRSVSKQSSSAGGPATPDDKVAKPKRPKCFPRPMSKHVTICSTTLWVGHLLKFATESDLADVFGQFGVVASIDMIPSRGCAYICMERRQDAFDAYEHLKKSPKLFTREVKIAWAMGKGMKEREFKDYYENKPGCSFIPFSMFENNIERLDRLTDGGVIDEESLSEKLKESYSAYQAAKQKMAEEAAKAAAAAVAAAAEMITPMLASAATTVSAADPVVAASPMMAMMPTGVPPPLGTSSIPTPVPPPMLFVPPMPMPSVPYFNNTDASGATVPGAPTAPMMHPPPVPPFAPGSVPPPGPAGMPECVPSILGPRPPMHLFSGDHHFNHTHDSSANYSHLGGPSGGHLLPPPPYQQPNSHFAPPMHHPQDEFFARPPTLRPLRPPHVPHPNNNSHHNHARQSAPYFMGQRMPPRGGGAFRPSRPSMFHRGGGGGGGPGGGGGVPRGPFRGGPYH